MSDRYEQPTEGGHVDEWGAILNQNFFDIGEDVDSLETQVDSIEPGGEHDHSGDALTPGSVDMQSGSVQSVPVDPEDIANREFVESEVASVDGGSGGGGGGTNAAVVSDATNLQSTVNNYGLVRISGRLDATDVAPITVPDDVCIEGYGTWRDVDWREYSDSIVANTTTPILQLEGNNCRVRGIGLHQQNSGGEAIRSTGYSSNISEVDIHSEGHGVHCTSPDGTVVPTEPRIYDSRIRSESGGGSGTRGIWIETMYDSKIIDNIVCGFDVSIDLEQNSQFVNGNHTYTHPADSHTVALRIDAGYVRVTDNRFEDAPTDAGIQLVSNGYVLITDNLFQMGDGTDGIRAEHTDEQNLSIIKNNMMFAYDDGTGGTALDFSSVSGFWRSFISDNAIYNFASDGTTSTQDATALSTEGAVYREPQDVRTITSPQKGLTAYHDPSVNSDGNTEGPAFYDGGNWVSQVDGSTIN